MYKCKLSVLIRYKKNKEENYKYYDEVKQHLDNITLTDSYEMYYDVDNLELLYNDDNLSQDRLHELFHNKGINTASIDISSFNTISIIHLIDMLFKSDLKSLRIIYTTGKNYPMPKKPEFIVDDYKLHGIKHIKTLKKFSGIYTPGYSPLYIFILGVDPIRTISVLRKYQPTKKIGIFGKPNNKDLMWRLDIQKEMYNNLFNSRDEVYYFP